MVYDSPIKNLMESSSLAVFCAGATGSLLTLALRLKSTGDVASRDGGCRRSNRGSSTDFLVSVDDAGAAGGDGHAAAFMMTMMLVIVMMLAYT